MKKRTLKTHIRNFDRVFVYSKTLNTYVQVNKKQLLNTLDKKVPVDMDWSESLFEFKETELYIH
jgi:hypothetical protein